MENQKENNANKYEGSKGKEDPNYYPNFYETYIRYSCDQWLKRAFVYGELLRNLEKSSTPISHSGTVVMVDIGPGTADVGALFGKSIVDDGFDLKYRSVDRISEFAEYPEKRLGAVGAEAKTIVKNDAFSYTSEKELLGELSLESDEQPEIILCEHVLYRLMSTYKDNPAGAIKELQPYFDALSENGLFLNVLSGKSDSDALRMRSTTTEVPAVDLYRKMVAANHIPTEEIPVDAALEFPRLTDVEWEKILTGKYEYKNESKHFKDTHDLITFFGTNIGTLRESGALEEYVLRLRKILDEKNNSLTLNVVMFISAPHASEVMRKNLDDAVSSAAAALKKYSPVAVDHLADVRILPDLHTSTE